MASTFAPCPLISFTKVSQAAELVGSLPRPAISRSESRSGLVKLSWAGRDPLIHPPKKVWRADSTASLPCALSVLDGEPYSTWKQRVTSHKFVTTMYQHSRVGDLASR